MDGRTLREMALDMPGTAAKERYGRPSYSVKKKTYITVTEVEQRATLKLTIEQQAELMERFPDQFEPLRTNLGKHGWTDVSMEFTEERLFRYVVDLAWRNVAPKWLIATRQAPPIG